MNTKNNRQFKDSAARMENALLELLRDKPFEKITVRLICERAGVNRSTFYAHYSDIFDMIQQMEIHLRKDLMRSYPQPGRTVPFSQESFIPFLKFIRRHEDFYRIALKTRRDCPIKQGIDSLWNQIIKPRCTASGILSENEMMFYFAGFQAGFTVILRRWVDCGCKESEHEIARIIHNFVPFILK